jgi:hypothetical protein
MRESDSAVEIITDQRLQSTLRRVARRIQFMAPFVALVLTAIALWATR